MTKTYLRHGLDDVEDEKLIIDVAQHLDSRRVLDSLADPIVASDTTNRIIYVNDSIERLLGWTRSELIGKPLTVLMPERFRAVHSAGFERYLATRIPHLIGRPVRVPALHRDGHEIDVELSISAIVDEHDQLLFVASLRDLKDRVELERQMVVTRYLQAAASASARITSHLNADEVLQTVVATLVEDFGGALARVWVYQSDTNMLHLRASAGPSTTTIGSSREWIDVATYPYKVGHVARTRQPFFCNELENESQFDEARVSREGIHAGAVFPLLHGARLLGVLLYFSLDRLPDELIQALSTFVSMVTSALNDVELFASEQRARAETEAERERLAFLEEAGRVLSSSLDYETTLSNVASLCVPRPADWLVVDIQDEDGTIRRLAVAHGDPGKVDLVRELQENHVPPPAERDYLTRVLRTGQSILRPWIDPEAIRATAGSEREAELLGILDVRSFMCVPMSLYGRTLGALSFVSSASNRQYNENDLRLAGTLAQRSAMAVDNARLYAEVREAVQTRDEFLSSVSHDLKNPLTALRGQAQLLHRRLERLPPEEASRWERGLDVIEGTASKLNWLINDLVDVAHLRMGRDIEIHRTNVDLVALTRQALTEYRQMAAQHTLTVVSTEPVLEGIWDAARLERAVANLLTNAIKYAPEGGVITVRIGLDVDGDHAVLSVQDEGIGIPEDDIDHIFDRFHRGSNVTDRVEGSGLGLAGVRQIAERHGGSITVISREGEGSTFTLRLPRRETDPTTTATVN